MRIAIVIGSTRPGRIGETVAQWVHEVASQRERATYELIDLKDYDLPLLCEPTVPGAANGEYEVPQTQRWAATIKEFDGYLFVTPEYNHGVPAALKNAFDVLYVEWVKKAIGFVSYGADSGVRAVEHWRNIAANPQMQVTRGQVSLSTFSDITDGRLTLADRREQELKNLLGQLEKLTAAMRSLREQS